MPEETEKIKLKEGEHIIYCVECGAPRVVKTSNWKQVKRCYKHQYLRKREYNSKYIRNKRKEKRESGEGKTYAPLI